MSMAVSMEIPRAGSTADSKAAWRDESKAAAMVEGWAFRKAEKSADSMAACSAERKVGMMAAPTVDVKVVPKDGSTAVRSAA